MFCKLVEHYMPSTSTVSQLIFTLIVIDNKLCLTWLHGMGISFKCIFPSIFYSPRLDLWVEIYKTSYANS